MATLVCRMIPGFLVLAAIVDKCPFADLLRTFCGLNLIPGVSGIARKWRFPRSGPS